MSAIFTLHKHGDRQRECGQVSGFLSRLPLDKGWIVTVEKFVQKRSPQQRKALFAAAYKPLMEHLGLRGDEEKGELHREVCCRYFGVKPGPDWLRVPIRTTSRNERGEKDEISMNQAADMYAFIQQFAAGMGCYVPDPDPRWRERAYTEEQP